MRSVTDVWQACWIDDLGYVSFLGESGKISKTRQKQQVRYKPEIIQLPLHSQQGTLVIYISVHIYDRLGVYSEMKIVEHSAGTKAVLSDLAIRVAMICVGIMVVSQSLIFFIQRPKEKALLLLSIFAFVVLFRTILSSGFYYFINNPLYFKWVTKLEYTFIIWPCVAGLHFFAAILPTKNSAEVVKFSYLILFIEIVISMVIPVHQMVTEVLFYQAILVILAGYVIRLLVLGVITKTENALLLLVSITPLSLAIINDIVPTQLSYYNVFIAEYALFFFIFIQTQMQASRFVTALDTAEHLTDNLQREVVAKTNELSDRNIQLQKKANYLEIQHDEIKLQLATDHLMGLYNRQTSDSYSATAFEIALKNNQYLSLMMIDLDNFKRVND